MPSPNLPFSNWKLFILGSAFLGIEKCLLLSSFQLFFFNLFENFLCTQHPLATIHPLWQTTRDEFLNDCFKGSLSCIHVVRYHIIILRNRSWGLRPLLAPEQTAGNTVCYSRLDCFLLNISKLYRLLELNQITYQLKIAAIKRQEHLTALCNKTKPFLMTQYLKPLRRQPHVFCCVADHPLTKLCSTATEPAPTSAFLIWVKHRWTRSPNYSPAKNRGMDGLTRRQGSRGSADWNGDIPIFNQLEPWPKELW